VRKERKKEEEEVLGVDDGCVRSIKLLEKKLQKINVRAWYAGEKKKGPHREERRVGNFSPWS